VLDLLGNQPTPANLSSDKTISLSDHTLDQTKNAVVPIDAEAQVLRRELTQMALVKKEYLSGVAGFYGWDNQSLDFTGDLPRQLSVEIPQCCAPSNQRAVSRSTELLYIHGMRVDAQDLDSHLSYLALCFGKPITVVVNGQEQPLFKADSRGGIRSVGKSAAGIFSSQWGSQLEAHAVLTTARYIEKHVIDQKQALQVVAHSQGGIILGNALDHLLGPQSKLTDENKQQIRDRVTILTFGSGEHFFPTGVKVLECAHGSDPVTRITTPTTVARNFIVEGAVWLHEKLGHHSSRVARVEAWLESLPPVIKKERAPVVHLKGDHSLKSYLENLPEFFIERYRNAEGGIDSEPLAKALVASILNGDYSDLVHARIIQERVGEGDKIFCDILKSSCSTEGKIGEFQVPYFQQLGRTYEDILQLNAPTKKRHSN
jgi:hypothetical protein